MAPPPSLHEEVQAEALRSEGCTTDPETVDSYRKAVRELHEDVRRPVFFLAANDKFYHPEVDPQGQILDGTLDSHCGPTTLTALLKTSPAFVLCSTST